MELVHLKGAASRAVGNDCGRQRPALYGNQDERRCFINPRSLGNDLERAALHHSCEACAPWHRRDLVTKLCPIVLSGPHRGPYCVDDSHRSAWDPQAPLSEQQSRGVVVTIPIDGALRRNPHGIDPSGRERGAGGPPTATQVNLGGIGADLLEQDQAIQAIVEAARNELDQVLGVVSVNIDHIHHFAGSQHFQAGQGTSTSGRPSAEHVRWLNLLDGAPLVKRASQLTGRMWPRLAGSDLIEPILDAAEANDLSVGFLGGSSSTHAALATVMSRRWPKLRVAGYWAPHRAELTDPAAAQALTEKIAGAEVTVLVVCLGKPRQEEWIAEHGYASGAKVCLAFGAVVDFLAGRVSRAPEWMATRGLEWAWRLYQEPRRLARRYLVHGPPAYLALQRNSAVISRSTVYEYKDGSV